MHNSKVLTLIQGLQAGELHWLQKFLASPFYSPHAEHMALFQYIKKYYPDLNSPKLNKAIACRKLYPKDPLNVQKLRKAMHGLAALIEEFLVAMQLRQQPLEKKKVLIKALGERNIYQQFQKRTYEVIDQLETQAYRDTHYFRAIHQLHLAYYSHVETSKQQQNVESLQTAVEYLDYYYLLQRQQLDLTIHWHDKLLGQQLDTKSLQASKENLQKEPVFQLYEMISSAETSTWKEAHYLKMETLFKKNIESIAPLDKEEIIRILLNQLSGQVNRGKTNYYANMLALYKFGLEQQLLFENGQIGEAIFTNIATVGLSEKEFDWVEQFIERYQSYLPTSVQTAACNLSLGLLYFHKKNYKSTIRLLLNTQLSETFHILKSRGILLRTYFEQFLLDDSYYELLIAQTQAFEKFVRRNEAIAGQRKKVYLNFILFTRMLANAKLERNVSARLYEKVANTKEVILKGWLLKKIEQLSS